MDSYCKYQWPAQPRGKTPCAVWVDELGYACWDPDSMIVRDIDKLSLQDYQIVIVLPLKGPDTREALMMFLKRLPVPSPHPLLAQMFWRIGTRLDATIVATVLKTIEANYLGRKFVSAGAADESFFDLNRKIVSYWTGAALRKKASQATV